MKNVHTIAKKTGQIVNINVMNMFVFLYMGSEHLLTVNT